MDSAKLRKYEHTLAISGAGVIAFGVWSVIKAVLYFLMIGPARIGSLFEDELPSDIRVLGISDKGLGLGIVFIVLFILLFDLLLRVYIGGSAIADGRRLKKKKPVYIALAVFVSFGLMADLFGRVMGVNNVTAGEDAGSIGSVIASTRVSVMVDVTSLIALIYLIVAAVIVRRMRKEM